LSIWAVLISCFVTYLPFENNLARSQAQACMLLPRET
jgi:hypothetical protein